LSHFPNGSKLLFTDFRKNWCDTFAMLAIYKPELVTMLIYGDFRSDLATRSRNSKDSAESLKIPLILRSMGRRTSITYMNEILEKYQKEKGGEMSSYLLKPTRKQIKEACLWLLDRRKEKYDERILSRFFQFKEGENKMYAIERVKGDKFKPIVNFLTGETKSTTPANLELISWLIDFKPRPLSIYLASNQSQENEITQLYDHQKKRLRHFKNDIGAHEIPETRVIQDTNKSITIISQINPSLKITTIVSL